MVILPFHAQRGAVLGAALAHGRNFPFLHMGGLDFAHAFFQARFRGGGGFFGFPFAPVVVAVEGGLTELGLAAVKARVRLPALRYAGAGGGDFPIAPLMRAGGASGADAADGAVNGLGRHGRQQQCQHEQQRQEFLRVFHGKSSFLINKGRGFPMPGNAPCQDQ